jgi:thiazole synthase
MLNIYGEQFNSRLLLGTARYPDPNILKSAIRNCGSEIVTVSLRRHIGKKQEEGASPFDSHEFWEMIRSLPVKVLPNTAGCFSAKEAVTTAQMAREVFQTDWVKLEVTGDEYTLWPDPFETVEAARILTEEGFKVFPYMGQDLVVGQKLVELGLEVLMPLASPIGSGQGVLDPFGLQTFREKFPQVTMFVDAGIGRPSDAAKVMEMGFDGVLLNTAVSQAADPVLMAEAFSKGIEAGREAYLAGIMEKKNFAVPSTPTLGVPFWQEEGR